MNDGMVPYDCLDRPNCGASFKAWPNGGPHGDGPDRCPYCGEAVHALVVIV